MKRGGENQWWLLMTTTTPMVSRNFRFNWATRRGANYTLRIIERSKRNFPVIPRKTEDWNLSLCPRWPFMWSAAASQELRLPGSRESQLTNCLSYLSYKQGRNLKSLDCLKLFFFFFFSFSRRVSEFNTAPPLACKTTPKDWNTDVTCRLSWADVHNLHAAKIRIRLHTRMKAQEGLTVILTSDVGRLYSHNLSNRTQWADPAEYQMTEPEFHHPKSDGACFRSVQQTHGVITSRFVRAVKHCWVTRTVYGHARRDKELKKKKKKKEIRWV